MAKYLRMELYRTITDKRFFLIIILFTAVMCGSITEHIQAVILYGVGDFSRGVLDKIMEIQTFDRFKALLTLLVTGLVSCTVSDDISSHFAKSMFEKINADTYVLVKWLANIISIILVVFISYSIFAALGTLVLGMPMYSDQMLSGGYFTNIVRYFPVGYIFLSAVLFSLFASLVTTIGMIVTALYPGRYLAYAVSFGVYHLLLSLSGFFPNEISLWYVSAGVKVLEVEGFLPNYMYAVGVFLFLSLIGKYILGLIMQRRAADGKL